ncbi:MAG: hypothetical protein C5B47_05655 [Verrucomicrobia bacterium]|nr:MAG: hypothetical protein C5B47_05655 [Verrucomicrobiota bacterium]
MIHLTRCQPRFAVTFSLPFENRGLRQDERLRIWYLGIGRFTAKAALATHLLQERPQLLVIAGFAGALCPEIRAGDAFLCENMSDAVTIQALLTQGWIPPPSAHLHTNEKLVSSSSEKFLLHRSTGGDLVDMETLFLIEVARLHSIPFITIRAVSDDVRMDLPAPESILYDTRRQRTRLLALAAHLAMKPRCIPGFLKLLKGSLCARSQLGLHLRSVLRAAAASSDFGEKSGTFFK